MLRDYQETAVSKMLWAKDLLGNDIVVAPMGSGKSHIIAEFAYRLNEPILILVPNKELLEQDLDKLSRVVDKDRIGVFSASMKSREVKFFTLATIQSAKNYPEYFTHFNYAIVDECFVAGTKIGNKNIEDIKVGDYVDSFNHKTKRVERKKVLATSKKTLTQNLYLTKAEGYSILSTPNHPIYVKGKGYIKVEKLKQGDIIYAKTISKKTNKLPVFNLWKAVNNKILLHKKKAKGIQESLLQRLCYCMPSKNGYKQNARSSTFFRKAAANERNNEKKGLKTHNQKRKWHWLNCARRNFNVSSWKRLAAFYFTHKEEKGGGISISLQNRLSKSKTKNSDRNRWWQPQFNKPTNTRSKENTAIRELRVESVSIQKQRSNERTTKSFVYNFQVEDNNNYFANGLLVHNCNQISPKRLEGMYNVFFRQINIKKVYGATASPYRQDVIYRRWGQQKWQIDSITTTKMINRYPLKQQFWDRMLYVIHTQDLIDQGFLSPVEYIDVGLFDHSQIPTNKSQSDFDMQAFDELIADNYSLESIANYIEKIPQRSKLVFCSSISQAEALKDLISGSELVTGTTPRKEREKTILDLKSGKLNTLLNVNLFIYGFDYPELEAVVLLRPTRSLALHTQAIGRVSRIAEGKSKGYVYDFVSNVKNLGKIEEIKIEKIDGKWNVTGGTFPQGFHNQELYKFRLKKPVKKDKDKLPY